MSRKLTLLIARGYQLFFGQRGSGASRAEPNVLRPVAKSASAAGQQGLER